MKQYKIAVVTPGYDGYLDFWNRHGERVSATIPNENFERVKRGQRLRVFKNVDGMPIAYGLGWTLFFPVPPTTDAEINTLVSQLRDVCSLSLDSLLFKYSMRRTLRNFGMIYTGHLKTDLKMYAIHHNLYKGY
ncbi:hypothetical protein HDR61_03710 [bacterium]|nr:hypothetical protein [bacterium]